MASRIRIPVKAYILGLFPQFAGVSPGGTSTHGENLRPLANGLAVPSFWSRADVTQAFADANRIWIREAEIEFTPVEISERTEVVPADENGMWIHFVNNLSPRTRGIGVGFVYDLPSHEGGGEEDVSRQSPAKRPSRVCRVLLGTYWHTNSVMC